eukprot:CAMPEP_0203940152 /NCGR_PEP_ID=MMETSP0359-20131031/76809_1 /ASSEMBLY_ACC=CAM_ASM_000338 /TAXON_ID=268821 /ORGANISM="Scrippsiella Hangoei, Strain SHTV-5" /LENGTH=75 /DNA_ID=CAMNT_0050870561 /DNA_START=345 /DNA_END=569 /DNA_ORIENTATION=-
MVWSCMALTCVSSMVSTIFKPQDGGISVAGWRETARRNAHAKPEVQALLRKSAQRQIHDPTSTPCFMKPGNACRH